MILKEGQVINDGENDLIVCATKEYKGSWYAYVLNSETDEVGFYKIDIENDIYNFELVEDEKIIEELILAFAKDSVIKHPEYLNEIKKISDLNDTENGE